MRLSEKAFSTMLVLVNGGVNFNKDVDTLSTIEIGMLTEAAKQYKYKPKPNNTSLSNIIHARFYLFMKEAYEMFRANNCWMRDDLMIEAAKYHSEGKIKLWFKKIGR